MIEAWQYATERSRKKMPWKLISIICYFFLKKKKKTKQHYINSFLTSVCQREKKQKIFLCGTEEIWWCRFHDVFFKYAEFNEQKKNNIIFKCVKNNELHKIISSLLSPIQSSLFIHSLTQNVSNLLLRCFFLSVLFFFHTKKIHTIQSTTLYSLHVCHAIERKHHKEYGLWNRKLPKDSWDWANESYPRNCVEQRCIHVLCCVCARMFVSNGWATGLRLRQSDVIQLTREVNSVSAEAYVHPNLYNCLCVVGDKTTIDAFVLVCV